MNKGYSEMAADEAAEAEALDWIEALVGDVADEPHEQWLPLRVRGLWGEELRTRKAD